jgi:pimeloyl-ACP methyl ester carboxylesterase
MTEQQQNAVSAGFGVEGLLKAYDPSSLTSPATDIRNVMARADEMGTYLQDMAELSERHLRKGQDFQRDWQSRFFPAVLDLLPKLATASGTGQWTKYVVDSAQRAVLFLDTLRRRGNQFVQHERQGCPPVLAYEYDLIIDGRSLERPVNYSLVHVRAPEGVKTRENTRPYIIIDPRAGHGSGIGGFKSESGVGVALAAGHPVYFVIFSTHPTPSQSIADVCRAEAQFVREVRRRHPNAPKPVVVGNCQGGWAAMLLAATNPDLTGPIVMNGSPLSYWSGVRGKNPLRYLGGVSGGVVPALMISDLGNGEFDGANLVQNFEALSPAATWWRKYYDVFSKGDQEAERYLQFERWWSGFYFMNEREIRWIVENLFVGNRLARGGADLDSRLHADLRNVRAPIIVFASEGDNITPPGQALNWIADVYGDVQEIKARGQRIVYTVHEHIGHLGIFVAASVAKKEHKEIVSTLQTIEAMAPGLYEMKIIDVTGEGHNRSYSIDFEERTIDDILVYSDDRATERPFQAVAKISEVNAALYDMTVRPVIRSMVSKSSAKIMTDGHPLRQRRYLLSDNNPAMRAVEPLADLVQTQRQPAGEDNAFIQWERLTADWIADGLNLYRDLRDNMLESWVYMIYGSPVVQAMATSGTDRATPAHDGDLRLVPEVRHALDSIDHGGFPEAVIRMLILLAHSRGSVRRDRLERSNHILTSTEPFASLGATTRNRIITRQSIIVDFEYQRALATLPLLLPDRQDRLRALELCRIIAGPTDEMNEPTVVMFDELTEALDLSDADLAALAQARTPAPATAPAPQAPAAKAAPKPRSRAKKQQAD